MNCIAQETEIELIDFTPSECDESVDGYRIKNRIVDTWYEDSILMVEVGARATCCVDFEPSIKATRDTLDLIFKETGDFCSCICCYQFVYHIQGYADKEPVFKLNGELIKMSKEKYITYPIKYDIWNGDTINKINKYGFKEGLHIYGNKRKPFERMIYKDDFRFEGSCWIDYDFWGRKIEENKFINGKEIEVKYYRNGKVMEECQEYRIPLTKSSLRYEKICKTFDKKGNVIIDNDYQMLKPLQDSIINIYAFNYKKENEIYINQEYSIKEDELDKIETISDLNHKRVIFSYEIGTNEFFIQSVIDGLEKYTDEITIEKVLIVE